MTSSDFSIHVLIFFIQNVRKCKVCLLFSSPEPKAPRRAICIPMTPASSVRQHFQTSSPVVMDDTMGQFFLSLKRT